MSKEQAAKRILIKAEKTPTRKQLELLRLIYRFRFVTSKSIAAFFKQSYLRVARVQLNQLCDRGYLAKRHDSSYRLQNRPAEYYLLPKAIPILREVLTRASERELKRLYDRPIASLRFINRSLAVFNSYLELRRLYGQRMTVATQSQLNIDEFSYFPHPLPDAFLTLDGNTDRESHYFIEYFDDAVSIGIHGRKIVNYMKYKEGGEWDKTGRDFPTVVIICQSPAMLKRAEKRTRYYENQEYSDISFRLIDLDKLEKLDSIKKQAWFNPIEKIKTTL